MNKQQTIKTTIKMSNIGLGRGFKNDKNSYENCTLGSIRNTLTKSTLRK